MERYRVSGEDLRGFYPAGTALGDVFRDIERELKAENRVVCRYVVNGMTVAEKDEDRFAAFDLAQVVTLEYLSEHTDALLRDVVNGWLDAIPELQQGGEDLATRLKAGATKTGIIKALRDLVENCEFLADSIQSARTVIGDGVAIDVNVTPAEETTKKALRDALRYLEIQDFVQLALVIEYDLNHGLEQWAEILKDMRFRLDHRGDVNNAGSTAAHSVDRGRGTC